MFFLNGFAFLKIMFRTRICVLKKILLSINIVWSNNKGFDMAREQERAQLHKTIWSIANDLRGAVSGYNFMMYVLDTMFYRFISENLTNYVNEQQRKNRGYEDFDYAKLPDNDALLSKDQLIHDKGFFILPSELFQNVVKGAKTNEALHETLHKIFKNIEASAIGTASEDDFKGLFNDFRVNDEMCLGTTVEARNKKLTQLLEKIGSLDFGCNYNETDIDAFGDAYEYLMTMYASDAGKSGGEFFTPQEVSELLARITIVDKTQPDNMKKEVNKVYDPACGSGSLLLKFAKILGKDKVRQGFYGQEKNPATYNLCRINMFLHDINYDKFDIALGDTLLEPKHWDEEPFEAICSNPPYSIQWEGDSNPLLINDPRFAPAGILAPRSKADLAFTMHMLSWLAANGTAAIVEFPGVLYRGGAEQKIRQYLIDNNYVDCVIQLPANLFFGVTIATCIIVLKKSKPASDVLFIDASELFVHSGNKNKLSDENIKQIIDAYIERKDVEHFTKVVSNEYIAENEHNLSVSSYVETKDTREVIDIHELNKKLVDIVAKQNDLRTQIDAIVKDLESE